MHRRGCQRSTLVYTQGYQRQRRKERRQSSLPQRRCGMLQRRARRPQGGYLGGERPRRFFGDFLIGEKVTLRSKTMLAEECQ